MNLRGQYIALLEKAGRPVSTSEICKKLGISEAKVSRLVLEARYNYGAKIKKETYYTLIDKGSVKRDMDIKQEVLEILQANRDEEFRPFELAGYLLRDAGVVRHHLNYLKDAGLVKYRVEDRIKYWSAA